MRTFLILIIFFAMVFIVLKKFIEIQKTVDLRNSAKANKDWILVNKSDRKIIKMSLIIFLLMFAGASLMISSGLILDYFTK